MNRLPTPLKQRRGRIPQIGRIRIGHKVETKSGKSYPAKLKHFRLTSQWREPLDQLAAKYGGEVSAFADPKSTDQWQLYSETAVLDIALPPDPLEGTAYELWGGRGALRRCDGETVVIAGDGDKQPDRTEPCICALKQALECDETTRLSVYLPDIRPAGFWRLDTKGIMSADGIRGMLDTLQMLQQQGITVAQLHLSWKQSRGGSREFPVVQLIANASIEEIVGGKVQADFASQAYAIDASTVAATPTADRSGGRELDGGSSRELEAGDSSVAVLDAEDSPVTMPTSAPTPAATPPAEEPPAPAEPSPAAESAASAPAAVEDPVAYLTDLIGRSSLSYDDVALYFESRYDIPLAALPGDDAETFSRVVGRVAVDRLHTLIERINARPQKFAATVPGVATEQRKVRADREAEEQLF